MLDTLKRNKKISQKNRHLKNLVDYYASPWGKRRGTFRDYEKQISLRDVNAIRKRFQRDIRLIAGTILATLESPVITDLPPESPVYQVLSWLLCDCAVSTEDTLNQAVQEFQVALPDAKVELAPGSLSAKALAMLILDTIIEPETIPAFYEIDYIEDIVPIIKSRYLGADGLTNPEQSRRIIRSLSVCTDLVLEDDPMLEAQLPEALKTLLGEAASQYLPHRYERQDVVAGYVGETMAAEYVKLRCKDNPKRYLEINTHLFEVVNSRATDKYEERDISLIYGYENNHHLTLRTLVGLIAEGKITPDDRVLVLGPRYEDEIYFFREVLGLPNTIGLDLRNEKDVLVEGDMHEMPFPDNTFKLVFGASVLEYAYDLRQVIDEIARVTERPGYVSIIHRTNRTTSPSSTQRSDIGSIEAATGMYYKIPHTVLSQDPGITLNPAAIGNFPTYVIQLNA